MLTLAMDIETIPNPKMVSRLPEPEVKLGNLKDPLKIQAKKEEAKQKQIEDMALSPLYGKVCCVCCYGDIEETYCYNDEYEIIRTVFDKLILYDHKIVTFNGLSFDIPFLYKRALILGVKPQVTMSFWMKRFVSTPHCDLRMVWANWNQGMPGSLNDLSEIILNTTKVDLNYKQFPELMKTNDGKERISEYCMSDCILTWNLYETFVGVLI